MYTILYDKTLHKGRDILAQSEKELEDKLIKQLKEQGFRPVTIKDENDLLENLKLQIETFNRIQLTDQEFKKIVIFNF